MFKILQSMSEFGGLWKHYIIQHAPKWVCLRAENRAKIYTYAVESDDIWYFWENIYFWYFVEIEINGNSAQLVKSKNGLLCWKSGQSSPSNLGWGVSCSVTYKRDHSINWSITWSVSESTAASSTSSCLPTPQRKQQQQKTCWHNWNIGAWLCVYPRLHDGPAYGSGSLRGLSHGEPRCPHHHHWHRPLCQIHWQHSSLLPLGCKWLQLT